MPRTNINPSKRGAKPAAPIHVSVDTLVQGVSQQPPYLRVIGQGEKQINGWSSPVEGLTKRNPSVYQALLAPVPLDNFYLEMMQLTETEQYAVLLIPAANGDLELQIRSNGQLVNANVHGPGLTNDGTGVITVGPTSYLWSEPLEGSTPVLYKNYSLISSGPIGLLLNRKIESAMAADVKPPRENNGIVFIQAVSYQVTYTVSLTHNGAVTTVPGVTTPSASDDNNQISTSAVASQLAANINAIGGWNAVVSDYIVEVKRDDGTEFNMDMDDTRSNTLGRAFTDRVTYLSELPLRAPDNYLVNVDSDPSTDVDDRWLQFQTRDGADIGEGAWAEAAEPGITYLIDSNTMPYVIRREGPGVIYVGPADGSTQDSYTFPAWGERTAGNEETIPTPDFIGNVLTDHVFFRQRYVICGGEIVSFSEVDDGFNFFQDSTLALTEQDSFHLRATSEISSPVLWLLPIDESLLVWSKTSQFQVRSADSEALTPITALIVRLSNIEMNPNVRPKLAAAKVLFATDEYGYTHFREFDFFQSRQSRLGLNLGGSSDVTTNLPKYVNGLITHWDVGEAVDYAVARSPEDPNTLYVYKYKWSSTSVGLQKTQTSWSKWVFGGEIQWVKFMDNELLIILTYDDRTELHVLRSDELEDTAHPLVHLDRHVLYPESNANYGFGLYNVSDDITATYDAGENITTFNLPFAPAAGGKIQAVIRFDQAQASNRGLLLGETTSNTLVCSMKGDWTGELVSFGEPYQFEYEFTKPYVMQPDSQKQRLVGELNGRTQILTWEIHHRDTGFYKVRVKRENRPVDSVGVFRARVPDIDNNKLTTETSVLETGKYRVPVYSKNTSCAITVESDSWLPVTISSATWEGSFSDRSKG